MMLIIFAFEIKTHAHKLIQKRNKQIKETEWDQAKGRVKRKTFRKFIAFVGTGCT